MLVSGYSFSLTYVTIPASFALKKPKEHKFKPQTEDPLKGLTVDYFYSGNRVGCGDNIKLDVCSIIMDAKENIYLRSYYYSGQRDTWKEVIKNQLIQHLRELGVENELFKNPILLSI